MGILDNKTPCRSVPLSPWIRVPEEITTHVLPASNVIRIFFNEFIIKN